MDPAGAYCANISRLLLKAGRAAGQQDIVRTTDLRGHADQGKLVEAEQMFERALQGREKAWGPEHTSTLNTVNNLGNLYANQGELAGRGRADVRAGTARL
jgi:hypothetical protein